METAEDILKGIVKDLALEYKRTSDPEVFEKILYRIDLLVLKVVNMSRSICPHLSKEDPEDIYRTAIIGLYKGLKTVKEEESSGITFARLIAYMRSAISSEFPYKVLPELYINSQKDLIEEKSVHENLEFELIKETIENLVIEGVISKFEKDLIFCRYLEEYNCEDLASMFGFSVSKIRKQIDDTLLVIRHQLRIRGIEGF